MARIGIFDSGLGGLTVVKEIKKKYPEVQIIYLGDTARVPYGTRSPETIIKFSLECARFLVDKGIGKLIIACNTASAYAYEEIKKIVKIPVLEMISYGAAGTVGYKKIGVIGTRATIKSGIYEREIKKINPGATVTSVAAPLFVPLVEEGEVAGELIEMAIKKSLEELKEVEALVLGCTHYPVLAPVIQKLLPGVKLINPAEELARGLDVKNGAVKRGEDEYCFTDMTERYTQTAEMFLGGKIEGKAERVSI
jgi:glutamate racemase